MQEDGQAHEMSLSPTTGAPTNASSAQRTMSHRAPPRMRSSISEIIADNQAFILPFLVFSGLFLTLIGIYGNASLFLCVNSYHSTTSDFIFLRLTNLGDGIIAVLLILALCWVSYRDAVIFLLITILITITINILRSHIFPELIRPVAYFGTSELLHIVPGYKPPMLGTFPSGHTATAFSVGLYLSLFMQNRITKFLLFMGALMVGYSRIYLSAHFPADVVVGATIGVFMTLGCFYLGRFFRSPWMDKKITYRPRLFIRQPS